MFGVPQIIYYFFGYNNQIIPSKKIKLLSTKDPHSILFYFCLFSDYNLSIFFTW